MKPWARIRHNLDTCRRGPPLIKLMSYDHREDAVGGAGKGKHIHTHRTVSLVIHRMDGASARIGHKIDTRWRAPTNQINGHCTPGGRSWGWGEGACSCKHTHTHSVTRDILDGWSLGRGSDTILTHVGEATPTNQINEL